MKDTERFIAGFRTFQKDYFGAQSSRAKTLAQGQTPKTMVIGCSDARVDPAILTDCELGDIFTVRNVANLVPPYEEKGGQHGVSAALEFAACHLEVDHIIVLGHSHCGGIKVLMDQDDDCQGGEFISNWMSIAAPARDQVLAELSDKDPALQQRATEQAAVLLAMENLRSFPFIAQRVTAGTLCLHGWYFDLAKGELLEYQAESGGFQKISGDKPHGFSPATPQASSHD